MLDNVLTFDEFTSNVQQREIEPKKSDNFKEN